MSVTITPNFQKESEVSKSAAACRAVHSSVSRKVTVVIPAYNIAAFITESLTSVFAQTYRNFEVVVVNDGSPDTPELEVAIKPFLDRIIYLKQSNAGAAAARNAGILASSGEIIAFLDGDDVWLPEFLESQVEFLEKTDFDMVYADAEFFGEGVPENQTYMQFSKSNGEVTTESLITWDCNVITSGTIVYRNKVVEAGMFDQSPIFKRGQDFELWFRLAKRGARIGYQRKVLLKYRVRAGSLTGNHVQQAERNLSTLNGIKEKFEMTASEQIAWERQMAISTALWNVERGKAQIIKGDFNAARKSFAAANRYYRKPKLSFVGLMLKFAPRLLQRVFARRADRLTRSQADVF